MIDILFISSLIPPRTSPGELFGFDFLPLQYIPIWTVDIPKPHCALQTDFPLDRSFDLSSVTRPRLERVIGFLLWWRLLFLSPVATVFPRELFPFFPPSRRHLSLPAQYESQPY